MEHGGSMPGANDGVLKYGHNAKGEVTLADNHTKPDYDTPSPELSDWDYT